METPASVHLCHLLRRDERLPWRTGEPLHDAVPLRVDDLHVAATVAQHDVDFAALLRRLVAALAGLKPGEPSGKNKSAGIVLIELPAEQVEGRDGIFQGGEAQP